MLTRYTHYTSNNMANMGPLPITLNFFLPSNVNVKIVFWIIVETVDKVVYMNEFNYVNF